MVRPKLEEVFTSSGIPKHTFVRPAEFSALQIALRTPGRCVVIEGPTGVGKTTALIKAIEVEIDRSKVQVEFLSARKQADRELLETIIELDNIGIVVIDDYHRLSTEMQHSVADRMKVLADEGITSTQLVILGITDAGKSLMSFGRDLSGRVDIIKLGRNPDSKVASLVGEGSAVMNADLPISEIVDASRGSFQLAQMLSYRCCLLSDILEQTETRQVPSVPFEVVLENVADGLAETFSDTAIRFAAGPRLNPEGRAPYLHLLRWLSESDEWSVRLTTAIATHPKVASSVSGVVYGDHLLDHIRSDDEFGHLLHYDSRNKFLTVEDPQFYFYLRTLLWDKFAAQVGFINIEFDAKYDFALSFAKDRRHSAKYLSQRLKEREISVFYDDDEQDRILAANLEEYLAPIYKSQASFVICFLSPDYPNRVWTRFESKHFHARFGSENVIPIVFSEPGGQALFDLHNNVGSWEVLANQPHEPQLDDLADSLSKKLAALRARPQVKAGEFYCSRCNLVLANSRKAPDRFNICEECGALMRID
ncbi:TIR domain-containing protein [Gordonia sp. PKS22-38]|uniref:TIR domain-containing protein n=1 Tax=Gordonia prachuapensis TaxID=3115651 RepID=A0ABU7N080_9ACTN|nr:TIR domain-containing protein [Gordonia sp. PKS22-38]